MLVRYACATKSRPRTSAGHQNGLKPSRTCRSQGWLKRGQFNLSSGSRVQTNEASLTPLPPTSQKFMLQFREWTEVVVQHSILVIWCCSTNVKNIAVFGHKYEELPCPESKNIQLAWKSERPFQSWRGYQTPTGVCTPARESVTFLGAVWLWTLWRFWRSLSGLQAWQRKFCSSFSLKDKLSPMREMCLTQQESSWETNLVFIYLFFYDVCAPDARWSLIYAKHVRLVPNMMGAPQC